MMLIKLPRINEKIALPKMNTNKQRTLSPSLLGCKSPKPTVDRVVNM